MKTESLTIADKVARIAFLEDRIKTSPMVASMSYLPNQVVAYLNPEPGVPLKVTAKLNGFKINALESVMRRIQLIEANQLAATEDYLNAS